VELSLLGLSSWQEAYPLAKLMLFRLANPQGWRLKLFNKPFLNFSLCYPFGTEGLQQQRFSISLVLVREDLT
jgi:hypothetical protein